MEKSSRALVLAAAFLLAATFLAYSGVRDHDFVGYDDGVYVSKNPQVLTGLNAENLKWAFTSGYASNWHPLTWISHMLDIELFGVDAGAMARTNVVLHGLTSVLLLGFVFRATGAFWPALLVALLFALHPIRVESVAWIAERKDVLSGLFWMTTLLAWSSYVRQPGPGRYAIVVVSFACGLMSKPVLVTLPFVLLLLDLWPFRRGVLGDSRGDSREESRDEARASMSSPDERIGWGRLIAEKLPLLAMAVGSSWITFRVQAAGGAVRAEALSPLGERIANAITSYVAYIGKTLWPVDLACFYPLPPNPEASSPWTFWVFASAIGVLAVSGLAWRERGRRPWLAVGWCWYLGTLVPMIGLVQVGNQSMADRYAYLPTIGLYLVLAGALQEHGARAEKAGALGLGSIALVAFALWTPKQVAVWQNGETLFTHAIAVTEDNYLAHYNLGTRLLRGQPARLSEARPHLEEAIRIHPGHPGAQLNLGAVEWLEGRPDAAVVHFEEALRLNPGDPEVHLSLGTARFEAGRVADSIAHFEQAAALEPGKLSAWLNLGTVLLSEGRGEEAARAFERALEISPGSAAASDGLRGARGPNRPPKTGTRVRQDAVHGTSAIGR